MIQRKPEGIDHQFELNEAHRLNTMQKSEPQSLSTGQSEKALRNSRQSRKSIQTAVLAAVYLGLFVLPVDACFAADEIPGAPQKQPIALTNGMIFPVDGEPIEKGTVVFDGGLITAIGKSVKPPQGAKVINLKGQCVYPGLIESHSQIGLKEVSSVRASVDFDETGSLNPNVQAGIAINPDSELIPVTRANGVLLALSAPSGGRISGKASIIQLDGWTHEDMALKSNAALVIDWPSPPTSGTSPGLKVLRQTFDDARAYKNARDAAESTQPFDIRLDAMRPILTRDLSVIAMANDVREIQAAVAFAEEQQFRLIIFGGHDAEQCAALLRQHDIPVIINSTHRRPRRRHEPYDSAYTLPERLRRAGVRFCISGSARGRTWNARNLPYHAATAAAHGLSPEDALRSVTLYPAQILGIDDRVGSLDIGKDATIIVTTGDPLETTTHVTRAYIQGRVVQLTSRHTRLHAKYREKYRQLKGAEQP